MMQQRAAVTTAAVLLAAALAGVGLAKEAGHVVSEQEQRHVTVEDRLEQEINRKHKQQHTVKAAKLHESTEQQEHASRTHEAAASSHEKAEKEKSAAHVTHSEDKKKKAEVADTKVEAEAFTFQALDLNRDGFITEAEYNQALGLAAPEQGGNRQSKIIMRRAQTTSIALDSHGEASNAASLMEEDPSELLQAKADLAHGQDPAAGNATNATGNETTTAAALAGAVEGGAQPQHHYLACAIRVLLPLVLALHA